MPFRSWSKKNDHSGPEKRGKKLEGPKEVSSGVHDAHNDRAESLQGRNNPYEQQRKETYTNSGKLRPPIKHGVGEGGAIKGGEGYDNSNIGEKTQHTCMNSDKAKNPIINKERLSSRQQIQPNRLVPPSSNLASTQAEGLVSSRTQLPSECKRCKEEELEAAKDWYCL